MTPATTSITRGAGVNLGFEPAVQNTPSFHPFSKTRVLQAPPLALETLHFPSRLRSRIFLAR
jgi:hypothetical protein